MRPIFMSIADQVIWYQGRHPAGNGGNAWSSAGYGVTAVPPANTYLLQVFSVEYDTTIITESVEAVAGSATKVDYQCVLK